MKYFIYLIILIPALAYAANVAVVEDQDGSVGIIYPSSESRIEDVIDMITQKPYMIIDESELPQSREFRNAWKIDNGKVIVDNSLRQTIESDKKVEKRIKEKIRKDAIQELKDEGELPQNYRG